MKEINPQSTNSISVKYSDVNIYIDGIRTNPKNSSGECVNPIFYKNDIYLPISFISEFTDKKISIDNTMKNIFIGDSPFLINNINDICTPISKTNCRIEKIFTFNGKTYKNALIFSIGKSEHYADVYY